MKAPKTTAVNVVILVLSQDTIQKIGDALGEIPTKFGAPIINDINAQVAAVRSNPAEFLKQIDALLAPVRAKLVVPDEPPGN